MPGEITIAEMVRNGTLSAGVAALLWAAAEEGVSFLTVAIPRFAGKTTMSQAVLDLRPPDMPLHQVDGDARVLERLRRERLGGYLVVAEFSDAPVPGYIWGEPVRRVFATAVEGGYSLQAALHAPSAVDGMLEVTKGNHVPDEHASKIGLVVYIERFGIDMPDFWRRVTEVYEVDGVEYGLPSGRTLYRWRRDGDAFEALDRPRGFGRDTAMLARRASVLEDLAASGRTSRRDLQEALARFRGPA